MREKGSERILVEKRQLKGKRSRNEKERGKGERKWRNGEKLRSWSTLKYIEKIMFLV